MELIPHERESAGKLSVGWDVRPIGKIGPLQRGFDLPHSARSDGPYPVVYSNGITNFHAKPMVRGPGVVTGRSGTIGNVHFVESDYWPHNTSLWVTNFNGFVPRFIYYLYTYIGFGRFASGSGVPTLNRNDAHSFDVPIPVDPAEQLAIATALSDVDALLAAQDALIAKKRAIKQGTMQELLTGKRRLPGFSGEWEMKLLGEVAHIKTGSRNNEEKVEDGDYPFFVRSEFVERIDGFTYDCEAILVPGEGKIGEIFHYINGRFDVHQRVYAITQFVPNVAGQFVHLYMTAHFGSWAMQNTVKATVDSLRLPTFQTFQMRLPPTKDEQIAIVKVLGDMDAEITVLETQRAKTAQLKQGMMQELLTGRIRLI